MRILNIHNYHVGRGGLEVIYDYTTRLFRDRGDEVIEYSRDSADIDSAASKLVALGTSIYSRKAYREVRELIDKHRPQVAYVHNVYPMLSTSVFDACHDAGVPTVMNVQDYKMSCPMGQHLRDGAICTKCRDGSVVWSAVHACKGGRLTSAAYAVTHGISRARRAYHRGVDLFATPSKFMAKDLVNAGFDADRIEIVPNMCDLPPENPATRPGDYAAYVGRISPEKGISVLIEAAKLTGIPVKIAGRGEVPGLRESAPAHVQFVGSVSRKDLPDFYRNARFLVVPSIWFEVYSVVLLEAMTMGIPIIGSKIGGTPEVVKHDRTGLLVPPGDTGALAAAMRKLWDNPELCSQLGHAGRIRALRNCNPGIYYERLRRVFDRAIHLRKQDAAGWAEGLRKTVGGVA